MLYTIVNHGDESNVTVILPGQMPLVAHSSHPNYQAIITKVLAKDSEGLSELFDASVAVAAKFDRLSERVTVAHGAVYFDGDEVDSTLTRQIVRFMEEGVEDWQPLVRFFENVQANPNEHSREMLFDWLRAKDFTITPEGNIVGYKGVTSDDEGNLTSVNKGRAIVDGEVKTGAIPNHIGAVVEMPRSEVAHNPSESCSTGLHVGTYDYAQSWAQSAMLEVHVNPRDVVSVPTDASGRKIRVCRYTVVNTIEGEHHSAFLDTEEDEGDEGFDAFNTDLTTFNTGDRVVDMDGDTGTVVGVEVEDGEEMVTVKYDLDTIGTITWDADDLKSEDA